MNIPEPEPAGSTKDQIYRSRGSGHDRRCGRVDHPPAQHPFRRLHPGSKGNEEALGRSQARLSDRQLSDGLLRELAAVDEYFKIPNRAAHAITMVAQTGESTQIMRFYYGGSGLSGGEVTLEDLRREAQIARAGYNALRAVVRALHQDQPAVLASLGVVNRMFLLGNV